MSSYSTKDRPQSTNVEQGGPLTPLGELLSGLQAMPYKAQMRWAQFFPPSLPPSFLDQLNQIVEQNKLAEQASINSMVMRDASATGLRYPSLGNTEWNRGPDGNLHQTYNFPFLQDSLAAATQPISPSTPRGFVPVPPVTDRNKRLALALMATGSVIPKVPSRR